MTDGKILLQLFQSIAEKQKESPKKLHFKAVREQSMPLPS